MDQVVACYKAGKRKIKTMIRKDQVRNQDSPNMKRESKNSNVTFENMANRT
jgi:hypothetical protein